VVRKVSGCRRWRGLVQIEPPVGDLAIPEGDGVRIARLDLEVIPLALGAGVQQGDDTVARGQEAEILDLHVFESAHQQLDDVPGGLGTAVGALRQVGVVDLDVVGEVRHDAVDPLPVEGLQNALVGLEIGRHSRP
jgi:hypothetical protein